MREWCEDAAVGAILKLLGVLPRSVSRAFAAGLARCLLARSPRLQRAAMTNLRIAFPDWPDARRRTVIRDMAQQLGWMAAEFARFPRLNANNISEIVARE